MMTCSAPWLGREGEGSIAALNGGGTLFWIPGKKEVNWEEKKTGRPASWSGGKICHVKGWNALWDESLRSGENTESTKRLGRETSMPAVS